MIIFCKVYAFDKVFTLPHVFHAESAWTARTPHGLRVVRTDFFISFYLCESAWSPHRVCTESE